MKLNKLKQSKPRVWIGALQIQLIYSMSYYITFINSGFMALMFWYTTAAPTIRPYVPWLAFWMFAAFMFLLICSVMILDYFFIYPSRQGYINKQAYKHANPVAADLQRIEAKQKEQDKKLNKIMEKLEIEDDD